MRVCVCVCVCACRGGGGSNTGGNSKTHVISVNNRFRIRQYVLNCPYKTQISHYSNKQDIKHCHKLQYYIE